MAANARDAGTAETDRSLVLRLYGSAGDFYGEARTGEGEPRAFSSWIEMVGLIEEWQADQIKQEANDATRVAQ